MRTSFKSILNKLESCCADIEIKQYQQARKNFNFAKTELKYVVYTIKGGITKIDKKNSKTGFKRYILPFRAKFLTNKAS